MAAVISQVKPNPTFVQTIQKAVFFVQTHMESTL